MFNVDIVAAVLAQVADDRKKALKLIVGSASGAEGALLSSSDTGPVKAVWRLLTEHSVRKIDLERLLSIRSPSVCYHFLQQRQLFDTATCTGVNFSSGSDAVVQSGTALGETIFRAPIQQSAGGAAPLSYRAPTVLEM